MTKDILTNDTRLKKLRSEYNRDEYGQVRYDVNFLFAHIDAQAAIIERLETENAEMRWQLEKQQVRSTAGGNG